MIKQLQEVFDTEIPLTRHMALQVVDHTDSSLTLKAPLENNTNHKCTAFGGSLYSVSVLSGWGLLYLLLKRQHLSGHIVIRESHTQFIKPVTTEIVAKCGFGSLQQLEKFLAMYRKKGIARISLDSEILCNDETAVLFGGTYVIHA